MLIKNANIPPIADAGQNQTVDENFSTVTLTGIKSSDKDGKIISYKWQQLPNGSPNIALGNPNEVNAKFIAPSVKADTEYSD